MGRELQDAYYASQREQDTAKRLELEDRRNGLRKEIIRAHEEFKQALKTKGEQQETKAGESRRTATFTE